jgi:DNA-binding PadR family transcriptional regulator
MYINIKYAISQGYSGLDVVALQMIKQNKMENHEDELALTISDPMIDKFKNNGLIKYVQAKRKSDSELKLMRLTKKGEDLLEDFTTPDITPGDTDMFNYLTAMYLDSDDPDRTIGNKKKTKMYCAIFRQEVGIGLHEMFHLCKVFLENYKYTKRLEYIFFNQKENQYGKFKNHLEDSPLYQFLDEKRGYLEKLWDAKIPPKDRKK